MKTKIFIGSSTEGLPIANAIQENLEHFADCTVWTQGVFGLSNYPIESLLDAVRANDFSVFVFSPDDVIRIRNEEVAIVRDNVILELGLFIGRYGKDRTFIVTPRGASDLRIPTDLLGLKPAEYDPKRLPDDVVPALGTACSQIKTAINKSRSFNRQITITPGFRRDEDDYPLKLTILIRNRTTVDAVITSHCFKMNSTIRPHPGALGDRAKKEFEVKFPDTNNSLKLFKYLLPASGSVFTFMPIDPSHTDRELQDAIEGAKCGSWHYECQWLTENYCSRKFEQNL